MSSVSSLLHRLPNGLTVAVIPVPNKVVALDCWVDAGSANESDADNGITHFLEHMMFKGTPRYGVGELDKAIMSVGGVWNAGTSKDFTHYYVTVAAPFFETALDAISDMMQRSLIDLGEFTREKQVILEEWRRKQDSPWGLVFDELYDLCFSKGGPYRRSVLGSFESIAALDRDDMHRYYRRHYVPSNMILMVVGDVEPAEVLPKIEAAFNKFASDGQDDKSASMGRGSGSAPGGDGSIGQSGGSENRSRPLPAEPGPFVPAQRRDLAKEVNETYLAMAHPAPPITARTEVLALDIAQTILADGRSSRLYRTLKEDKRLVNSVSAGFPTHRYESMFYVLATLSRENVDAVLSETSAVLGSLATAPPSPEEMDKAKRLLRNAILFQMETNTGRSGLIGYYYTITGSTEFFDGYLEALAAITPADVAAVVQKYLAGEPSIVMLEPVSREAVACDHALAAE